jgi:hypothetical protein
VARQFPTVDQYIGHWVHLRATNPIESTVFRDGVLAGRPGQAGA